MGLHMFRAFSHVSSMGDGGRAAHLTVAVRILLLALFTLCGLLSSFAQAPNPLGSLLGKSQTQPSQAASTPVATTGEAPPPAAIPLPDVAMRGEELMRLLREISGQLPTREELDA